MPDVNTFLGGELLRGLYHQFVDDGFGWSGSAFKVWRMCSKSRVVSIGLMDTMQSAGTTTSKL